MKWIEIVYNSEKIIYNMDNILSFSLKEDSSEILFYLKSDDYVNSIRASSIAAAENKYDLIKRYIKYDSVPAGGLTIESE